MAKIHIYFLGNEKILHLLLSSFFRLSLQKITDNYMSYRPKNIIYLLLCCTSMILSGCANMVTPTGGPKDVTPPKVVETLPENHSTNFNGRKIEITFDEYVTLENANQNVIISPPLAVKPDIKLSNKTVVIKFKEALLENTTYTIDFGKSIKDLHEGNEFKDYIYTFSTGEVLDTLSIAGSVVGANDKKAMADVFVTLYEGKRDSLFFLPTCAAPDRVTKTDKNGKFRFSGLAATDYLVFALKDVNSNLYYDLPNEEVAFLDSLVHPFDSTAITLYMFTEVDTTQVLLEKKLIEEGMLRFVFRHPAEDVVISTPEILPDTFNLISVASTERDTIWWYFSPHVKDSLWVQVKYDTLINDSTRYSLKYKETRQQRNAAPATLTVKDNLIIREGLLPGDPFILNFSEPVVNITMADSAVFKADTVVTYGPLQFEKDDEYGFRYRLICDSLLSDVKYSIEIPDSVFWGIRGRTHAAIKKEFHVLKEDEYGNIMITVAPPEGMPQVVVELCDANGKVIRSEIIKEQQKVEFRHLAPAKYKIRALLDKDANGKWSTGNYHKFFLPESYVHYKDELDVKAGWDIDLEEIWNL